MVVALRGRGGVEFHVEGLGLAVVVPVLVPVLVVVLGLLAELVAALVDGRAGHVVLGRRRPLPHVGVVVVVRGGALALRRHRRLTNYSELGSQVSAERKDIGQATILLTGR